ncbi:hypothetical protein K438DRAFT_1960590 [Mycena galopus ATCC 62051]|nr:hypothetical protein K438DRAFT_1960590 [Mycena galopus ATCC 62051]
MSDTPTPDATGETATAGTNQFVSASSSTPHQEQQPDAPEPRRRFKIHVDFQGVSYLRDTTTGDRYEISDDEVDFNSPVPEAQGTDTDASPSSPSSITEPSPQITGEEILAAESLLTTSGLVAGQRYEIGHLAGSVHALRDEVSHRLDALSEAVVGASHKLKRALEDNLRILCATGTTDLQLAELSASIRSNVCQPATMASIPPTHSGLLAPTTDMAELQPAIDRAIPPKRDNKSSEAFKHRARAMLNHQENAAGTFQAAHTTVAPTPGFAREEPPHLAKHTRFNAMESASMAGTRRPTTGAARTMHMGINQSPSGYVTQPLSSIGHATVFEMFVAEKMAQISRIIERQLGEVMEAPPKAPRMRDPPMYNGEDDDEKFMAWFGRLVTFLQGYSLGRPKYDVNHIVYLKTALDSHALEWFASEVEPIDRDTTQDFEGVQYDPPRGIKYLVSELRRTAGNMREPPAEFTIRQRFMRLIPSDAHDELISHGMRPEYTELELLKNHARVWLESRSMMRGGATRAALRPAPRAGTSRGVPARQSAPRAVSWAPSHTPAAKPVPAPNRAAAFLPPRATPTAGNGTAQQLVPNSTKTCFSCGLVGHIASDPKCSKFNDSISRAPRPALRAGRVESSYSVDEEEVNGERDPDSVPTEEDLEGTWGGHQYKADELLDRYDYPADYEDAQPGDDPNEALDIDTLLQEDSEPEIRVGAMRPIRHHFSMRIHPTDEVPTTAPGTVETRHMRFDTDVTVANLGERGLTPWTADDEHRIAAERGVGWDTGLSSHEQLLAAFYEQHGNGPLTTDSTLELAAIDAFGAEELAREVWAGILQTQPLMIIGFSPEYLRSTSVDIEPELQKFRQVFSETQQTLADLRTLGSQRHSARVGLREIRARAAGSDSRAPLLGERALMANGSLIYDMTMSIHLMEHRALMANGSLIYDMTMSIHLMEHRLERIGRTRRTLEEESTRQALEREEFNSLLTLFSTRRAPSGPVPSSPPSYPGSPHESDSYYLDDEAPLLSRVCRDSVVSETALSTVSSLSDSTPDHAGDSDRDGGIAVPSCTDLTASPNVGEEIILRSVEVLTSTTARQITTYVTPTGELRVEHSALPRYHHLNPEFQEQHRQAMDIAITELANDRHRSRRYADHWVDGETAPEVDEGGNMTREINGFPDQLDGIFQGKGLIYHEG